MARYRVIRQLARGGMAEVFVGRALGAGGFEKPVAVKRILPTLAVEPDFLVRFYEEARLTERLQHANVVQVFDVGSFGPHHYMILEFVDGENLQRLLTECAARRIAVPLKEAVFIGQQVAEALAYAHEMTGSNGRPLNVVHRDINPGNIMVSVHGAVKLADFGIAKASMVSTRTAVGLVRGKAGYFTPETSVGKEADQRSDVFLLGATLYHLLVGEPLFKERNFAKSLIEAAEFKAERLVRPQSVPLPLWELLLCTLQADPKARLSSARELSHRLTTFLFEHRLRVGPTDVAQLFERVFDRRVPPLELSPDEHALELELSTDAVPKPPPSAPRPSVPEFSEQKTDAAMPAVPLASLAAPAPPKGSPISFVIDPPYASASAASLAPPAPPSPASGPSATSAPLPDAEQRPRRRFGEICVQRNLLTRDQLSAALARQREQGGRLGDICVALGHIDEGDVYAVMAEQRGQMYVRTEKLARFEVPEALRKLVPKEAARRLAVLPLRLDTDGTLFFATATPGDDAQLQALRVLAGVPGAKPVMVRPQTLEGMLERCYGPNVRLIPTPKPAPTAGSHVAAASTLTTSVALAGSGVGDDSASQQWRLTRLVRRVATALGVPETVRLELEAAAAVLFAAGRLEHREPFAAPNRETVEALAHGSGLDLSLVAIGTLGEFGSCELAGPAQHALAAALSFAAHAGDPDPSMPRATQVLARMRRDGWLPPKALAALSDEVLAERHPLAVVGPRGGRVFAIALALARAGYDVRCFTDASFLDLMRPAGVVVDAGLETPAPLELVKRAVSKGARVIVMAKRPQTLEVEAWRTLGDVDMVSFDDTTSVERWAAEAVRRRASSSTPRS